MDTQMYADSQRELAERSNREGDFALAAALFGVAAEHYAKAGAVERALRAKQQQAVNLRLAGDAEEAELMLAKVGIDAGERGFLILSLSCEIDRALALAGLPKPHLDEAKALLEDVMSEPVLRDSIRLNMVKAVRLTYAVACGHLARVEYLLGNREAACNRFEEANRILHGSHDEWELNNAIWWMKVLDPINRMLVGARALQLAIKTHRRQRAYEAMLLIVSPRLYERIKHRRD